MSASELDEKHRLKAQTIEVDAQNVAKQTIQSQILNALNALKDRVYTTQNTRVFRLSYKSRNQNFYIKLRQYMKAYVLNVFAVTVLLVFFRILTLQNL